MKQPDIQHLILQDLKFKMSAWRAIAFTIAIAFGILLGLFISSEAELKSTKAKLNNTVNCQK
jgi:hypothetical protein|nr:MAG TPA: Protein of unknown function (DUF1043) [Bacteriophage sp.]